MVKRKNIGILYSYNEKWIGGTYYVINLICSLNLLPDNQKPNVLILFDGYKKKEIEAINYPYIAYKIITPQNPLKHAKNFFCKFFFNKSLFDERLKNSEIDYIFPLLNISIAESWYFKLIDKKKHVYWIPDFQDRYLPHLFSQEELTQRKKQIEALSIKKNLIVFSSENSQADYTRFYPSALNKTKVVSFSVFHPKYIDNSESLLSKYKIQKPYFIVPNQFWMHKNHEAIIEASKILKDKGKLNFTILFTGKEHEPRYQNHVSQLKETINELGLSDDIHFLGFIDRTDQIGLLRNAKAIIQPSFFEGWSTVVEDVKAIGQYILLSDIPVHREQMKENVLFFNPYDSSDLADKIDSYNLYPTTPYPLDYNINQSSFANKFIHAIEEF